MTFSRSVCIFLFLSICWLLISSSSASNTNNNIFFRYYKSFRTSTKATATSSSKEPIPPSSRLDRRSAYIPGFCYPVQVAPNTYVKVCLHNGLRRSVHLMPNSNE
ncbi:unnamed protein product [Adineta ricciae]|uniref:Uncharacterized protein n=1 Tax=Adineta ricciae TaxID=249248 RepID=A0A813VXK6_ADIRI|nr:unnamed protein product [Adineta ricciae]